LSRAVRDSIKAEGGVILGSDIPVGEGVVAAALSVDEEEEDEEDTDTLPGFVHPDTITSAMIIRVNVK
jgi:hypothetical protein